VICLPSGVGQLKTTGKTCFALADSAVEYNDPELESDSDLWRDILTEALEINPYPETGQSLYQLLRGLRMGGARLRWTEAGRPWALGLGGVAQEMATATSGV